MRLNIDIYFKNENTKELVIPTDYRRYILSLIKEAIQKHNPALYDKLFSKNVYKYYTFSIKFNVERTEKGKLYLKDNIVRLKISSPDMQFLEIFKNFFDNLNGKQLFGYTIHKCSTRLYTFSCKENSLVIKTLSPVLVRQVRKYIVPVGLQFKTQHNIQYVSIDDYIKALEGNINKILKYGLEQGYLKSTYTIKINLFKLKASEAKYGSNSNKQFVISLPAVSLVMEIVGDKEALTYLYDTGIGSRRSQGFGMLEVI